MDSEAKKTLSTRVELPFLLLLQTSRVLKLTTCPTLYLSRTFH
eukprot:XP_001709739.1 Hypothetical protein GL50803_39694 [Giardia lamblia ATCC 50803]